MPFRYHKSNQRGHYQRLTQFHLSRASTSLMVQRGADKRKDDDLMKGLSHKMWKTRKFGQGRGFKPIYQCWTLSHMLLISTNKSLKYFQRLSKLTRIMMDSSPWKSMSKSSGGWNTQLLETPWSAYQPHRPSSNLLFQWSWREHK